MTKAKIYLLVQSAVCIALAAWLSLSAVEIYREGAAHKAEHPMESIYTPEDIAQKAAPIAPLFFMSLGLLAAGLMLGIKDKNAEKPGKNASLSRCYFVSRIARPSEAMLKERRRQRKLLRIGWGLFALCMAPVLIYLLNPAHFPSDDPEGMFLGLMRVLLPCISAGLGSLAVTSIMREKSLLLEAQAAKEQIKEEKATGSTPIPMASPKRTRALQAVLILAAIVFIIAGALNGSARDVLYKAITICTECVGLG